MAKIELSFKIRLEQRAQLLSTILNSDLDEANKNKIISLIIAEMKTITEQELLEFVLIP